MRGSHADWAVGEDNFVLPAVAVVNIIIKR